MSKQNMLLTKLTAMSVGPLWLLRPKADDQTHNSTSPGSIAIVLAAPMSDEGQQRLLENCLFATGWDMRVNYFYLTTALEKLTGYIAKLTPKCMIVFGIGAAKLMNSEFVSGQVHHYENIPLIATHHPEEMVMSPHLKAQVWTDLCMLKDVLADCENVGNAR